MEILEAFGVDVEHGGGADFLELVYRLAAHERWHREKPSVGAISKEMAQQRRIPMSAFWGRMKWCIKGLVEADDATLEAFGIVCEKRTCGQLAAACAQLRLKSWEQ